MKSKKLLAGILSAAMVFCSMSFPAFADDVQTTDENTTNENTVTIATAQDFIDFIAGIEGNSAYEGKTIKLSDDIDLSNAALTQNSGNFAGTFDGDNHKVSNFTMTKPLFSAHLRTMATVKNLTVENVTLNNSEETARLGIICKNNNGIMENITVKSCKISSPDVELGVAGGLAAMTQDGSTTKNCKVEGLTINAPMGAVAIGGAFGLITGNENTKVEGITTSDVTITATAETEIGSCYGTRQGTVSDDNITDINAAEPVVTTAVEPSYDWYTSVEDGTEYNISNANELLGFANIVNGTAADIPQSNFANKKITLINDIDLAGIEWIAISNVSNEADYFCGEFDGNNKTISNLSNTQDVERKGLFGLVTKSYIHDFTLKDVNFSGTAEKMRLGALAANLQYWNVVKNVTVDGLNIDVTSNNGLIGGLIGYEWKSQIDNTSVKNATINLNSSTAVCFGGMIAYGRGHVWDENVSSQNSHWIDGSTFNTSVVQNLTTNSTVDTINITANGSGEIGGFFGSDTYNYHSNYFQNCSVSNLDMTLTGTYTAGGFVAYNKGTNGSTQAGNGYKGFFNCSAQGKIVGDQGTYGGFVGICGGRPHNYENASCDVDIICNGTAGGFAGATANYLKHTYTFDNCTANGDIESQTGLAGGFIGSIGCGGDATGISVAFDSCAANGTVKGATAGGFIAAVNDTKSGNHLGGTITLSNITPATNVTGTDETFLGNLPSDIPETVEVSNYVAEIADVKYTTFAAAIADAKDGATVTLLSDVTIESQIEITKNITLDFNNKEVTTTGALTAAFRILADVTVKNGNMDTTEGENYCFIVGSFTDKDTLEGTSGKLTIENGTYKADCSVVSVTLGTATIKGGNYSVVPYEGNYTYLLNCIDSSYKAEKAKISVTGGKFENYNPMNNAAEGSDTSFVADGYTVSQSGNKYTVIANDSVVATITTADNKVYNYTSLPKAVLNANSGDTVKLISDIHIDKMTKYYEAGGKEYFYWVYVGNKKITIDFAGHSIDFGDTLKQYTGSNNNAPFYQIFYLAKDADITVTGNGTVDVDANRAADSYIFAASGEGNINITIENGTFYGAPCVVKNYNNGNVIKINGGTFGITETYKKNYPQQVQGVLNSQGASSKTIQLYGGTVIGNSPRFFDDGDLVAEGYAVEKIGDNYNVIPETEVIATLATTYDGYNAQYEQTRWDNVPTVYGYKTLADAIANAKDGDTVTLLADASGDGIVIDEAKFKDNGLTIDLSNHTYTVTDNLVGSDNTKTNAFQFLKDNKITIKNGTLTSSADVKRTECSNPGEGAFVLIMDYAELTLENVTLDGTNLADHPTRKDMPITLSNNCGTVNINNSVVKSVKGYAFDVYCSSNYGNVTVIIGENTTVEGYVNISGNTDSLTAELKIDELTYNEDADYVQEGRTFKKVGTTEEPGFLDKILVVSNKNVVEQEGQTYYPVQVFAGIDSLKYKNVGFKMTAKRTGYSNTVEVSTKDVYTSMTVHNPNGKTQYYTPDQFDGKYLFGHQFLFSIENWTNDDTELIVTPYATTLDGTRINGTTKTINKTTLKGTPLFKEEVKTNEEV